MQMFPVEEQIRRMNPVSAPPEQRAEFAKLSELLAGMAGAPAQRERTIRLVGPRGELVTLPESLFYVLGRVAEVLARGDAVTIVPVGKELTTQQAADLLNVSRQYLVRLLEEGRLPYTKTGSHRRLRVEDVLAFKEKRDAARSGALRELSELTEDFGGYDGELK